MTKIIFCLSLSLLLFCGPFSALAQSSKMDVLYLKNGNILRGKIIERPAYGYLHLLTTNGSEFKIHQSEIDSSGRGNWARQYRKAFGRMYYYKDRGYVSYTELSLLAQLKDDNYSYYYYYGYNQSPFGLGLKTTHGYRVNNYFYMGGGFGVDYYISTKEFFMPVFVRVATEPVRAIVSPLLFFDVGYSFFVHRKVYDYYLQDGVTKAKTKGGYYINGGGGLRINTKGVAGITLTVSYLTHPNSFVEDYGNGTLLGYDRVYGRLSMNMGVSF